MKCHSIAQCKDVASFENADVSNELGRAFKPWENGFSVLSITAGGRLTWPLKPCFTVQNRLAQQSLGITLMELFYERDAWLSDGELDPVGHIKGKMAKQISPISLALEDAVGPVKVMPK